MAQRKSSDAPEDRKQLVRGSWCSLRGQGREQDHRHTAAAGSSGEPSYCLRTSHTGSCSVQWAQFLPPSLLERAAADCAKGLGWRDDGPQRPPRMPQPETHWRVDPGQSSQENEGSERAGSGQANRLRQQGPQRTERSRLLCRGYPRPLLPPPLIFPTPLTTSSVPTGGHL